MKGTARFLGTAAILTAASALYLLGEPGAAELIGMSTGEPRVTMGFVGMARFGRWRLICVPGPARDEALAAAAASPGAAKAAKTNSCRINQEMPASPPNTDSAAASSPASQPVIVAANFRLVGPKRMPAAMLRLPVTARPGDPVSLRFEDGANVPTPVRDCAKSECLAAGTLTQADWDHLSIAKTLRVMFPATGRQWVMLDLPLDGLAAAIAALERAEIAPPS